MTSLNQAMSFFLDRGNFASVEPGFLTCHELEGLGNALVVRHLGQFGVSRAAWDVWSGSMARREVVRGWIVRATR